MTSTTTRLALILALSLPFGAAIAQDQGDVDNALDALGIGNQLAVGNDIYVVVNGDTLWDICEQFFADAEYWPTLWSINNDEITNPHYIYPGQLLRFQPGTDVRLPGIVVGDAPDIASFDIEGGPTGIFESYGPGDCKVHVPFAAMNGGDVTLAASSFMTRSPIEPLGVVEKAPAAKMLISSPDLVYMRFRNTGDVNCGDVYAVYEVVKEVRHPEVRSARLGHVHRVLAEVLISDVGDRWVTGRVVQAYGEITRGALITDRVPVRGRVRTQEMAQAVDGFVIDKAHDENLLVQSNQVIFIDRGRSDGVAAGTIFWVVRRGDGLTVRERQIDQTLPDQVVGRLVVFSADENVSTAVMTDQALAVNVGDRITSRLD